MRILIWSELYWPAIGGAEIITMQLVESLQARGHEVAIVTSHDNHDRPDQELVNGCSVHRFRFREGIADRQFEMIAKTQRQITRFKKEFAPELIHINSVGPSSLFHLTTRAACPVPVLVTLQQNILPEEETGPDSVMGRILRDANRVSCVSDELLCQARSRVPETIAKSSTVYNTVRTPHVTPQPLPWEPPTILFLGRLVPQKGVDTGLHAWARAVEQFPDARLIVAGDGADRVELQSLSAALGLDDSVTFEGWVDPPAVPEKINQCTAVLMPSRREGLPLVGVQAALMGRPIIGSRTTGITELVDDHVTGTIVEVDDVDGFAAALVSTLGDRQTTIRQGEAARRRRAKQRFNWDRTVDAYCGIYESLMEESAHGKLESIAS